MNIFETEFAAYLSAKKSGQRKENTMKNKSRFEAAGFFMVEVEQI